MFENTLSTPETIKLSRQVTVRYSGTGGKELGLVSPREAFICKKEGDIRICKSL
jgi:hypothetical protein